MTPAQLQTIEEIFRAALDQEPDQIGPFLDTACKGDELLRRKVETLVASHRRAGGFIATSAVDLAAKIIQKQQADLLIGQTIGHYKISKRIGTGGMGEVYLATDVTAGRKAALKLLPARFTGDAERLKRFQQEARAVVALNHPNILTVYEIGEDHSTHYIASELIEGETLRERLARERMGLDEAIDVAIQVATALAAAHQAGIVHRDIKPENIMLRPDGYVKVLDFGIAKLAEQEVPVTMAEEEAVSLVETNLGSIMGTVRYMSPEQARGAPINQCTADANAKDPTSDLPLRTAAARHVLRRLSRASVTLHRFRPGRGGRQRCSIPARSAAQKARSPRPGWLALLPRRLCGLRYIRASKAVAYSRAPGLSLC